MRNSNTVFVGRLMFLAAAVITAVFAGQAYCQTGGIALLLQQTPVEGGRITPEVGVHHFDSGASITLTAVPKPGYQFIYWLGDVSDMTSNSTIVYLDAPKIVIAVFERTEYEVLLGSEMSYSMPGGGLYRSAPDYSNQGYTGGGAKRPHKYRWSVPHETPEEPEEPENDFPAPDEPNNDFPVPDEPIPEPATALLLGLGALGLVKRRRQTGNKSLYKDIDRSFEA